MTTLKVEFKSLNNFFEDMKKNYPEMSELKLQHADGRLGKRIAIVKIGEHGSLYVLTAFMTYPEMEQFLRGYSFKAEETFKRTFE